jgi:hypothetical protein
VRSGGVRQGWTGADMYEACIVLFSAHDRGMQCEDELPGAGVGDSEQYSDGRYFRRWTTQIHMEEGYNWRHGNTIVMARKQP